MENIRYYRLLNEQENCRDKMRMANTHKSKEDNAIFKRLFREARNRLRAFKEA